MEEILELMLGLVCLTLIVMSFGLYEILCLGTWLRSRLTRLRKTKTDHTP